MDYYDLVKQSIVSFMKGNMPSETASLKEGGLKYTPEYFDNLEKDFDAMDTPKKETTDKKEASDES